MKHYSYIAIALVLVLALASTAWANGCVISVNNFRAEVRGQLNDFYSTSISAENNDQIDVRVSFDVDAFTDANCPDYIQIRADIYKQNNDGNWQLISNTSMQNRELSLTHFNPDWPNQFTVNSSYQRYKVVGVLLADGAVQKITDINAYVDTQNNDCSGIHLITQTITANEGHTGTRTFTIENNTNKLFDVSAQNLYFSSALIHSGNAEQINDVSPYSSESFDVSIDAGFVSGTTTITGTFGISGYLGSTYCSENDIGKKNFGVTVVETGATDTAYDNGSGSSVSGDCADIIINANDFSMSEGTQAIQNFYIKNNSDRRFEITEVSLTNNGVELSNYYNEKYASPNGIADIVIKAVSPNLPSSRNYSNVLKVRGLFSNGKVCSFSNIQEKSFVVSVNDSIILQPADNCSAFAITVPASITVSNYGKVQAIFSNSTSKNVTVYVESDLDVTPTIIGVPANSGVGREVTFSINKPGSDIYFRPVAQGCTLSTAVVHVTNNVMGNLSQVSTYATVTTDGNRTILSLEFNNPTNKLFNGLLKISAPTGWTATDRMVAIAPGKNTVDVELQKAANAVNGNGTATITADGGQLSVPFTIGGNEQGNLAGFFLLDLGTMGLIALVAIIIIVVVVAVVLFNYEAPRQKEPWELE